MAYERRWIVLAEDGRHVSLGRSSDPDPAELSNLVETMHVQGLTGWLAVMEGDYYAHRATLTVLMVRTLTSVTVDWNIAVAAFQDRRAEALNFA